MFWGTSPALDLIEEYKKHYNSVPEELNIFIIGGSDVRHVLKTISRLHNYGKVTINFYLVDICLELIARQLLLLNVALQSEEKISLEKKTRFYMEIYGNTLVRPAVAKYLTAQANYLVDFITRDINKPSEDHMSLVNIEGLKYKERDYLENLFKFWASNTKSYDIKKFWDDRVRKHLGVRYDTKFGAFDWDLHMKLHNVGANQITIHEYKDFRASGISFTWIQSEVSKDNRTFVSSVLPNGENKFIHRGYLGDVSVGPYITYGLTCDQPELLKSQNGVNSHRATDVTEYNLKQIFYQIFNGVDHKPKIKTKTSSEEKITEVVEEKNGANSNLENVRIHFLSCYQFLRTLPDSVSILWIANNMVDLFSNEFVKTLKSNEALVLFEGVKYFPDKRKEDFEKYEKKIQEISRILGEGAKEIKFDASKDDFAKYLYKKDLS